MESIDRSISFELLCLLNMCRDLHKVPLFDFWLWELEPERETFGSVAWGFEIALKPQGVKLGSWKSSRLTWIVTHPRYSHVSFRSICCKLGAKLSICMDGLSRSVKSPCLPLRSMPLNWAWILENSDTEYGNRFFFIPSEWPHEGLDATWMDGWVDEEDLETQLGQPFQFISILDSRCRKMKLQMDHGATRVARSLWSALFELLCLSSISFTSYLIQWIT